MLSVGSAPRLRTQRRFSGAEKSIAHGGATNAWGVANSIAWRRIELPIVQESASGGASLSPYSERASRPTRKSAPESGARTASPEQSAKSRAETSIQRCVVPCHARTERIERSAAVSHEQTDASRTSVRSGSRRASPQSTESKTGQHEPALYRRFSSWISSTRPVSRRFGPWAPQMCMRISLLALPPSIGRSCTRIVFAP